MERTKTWLGTLIHRLCIAAFIAVIGFSIIVCDDSSNDGKDDGKDDGNIPPEEQPAASRWWSWTWTDDPPSTATVDVSVADDEVCTITVGGVADETRWKGFAAYNYTEKQGVSYKYTFEAWTKSGEGERTFSLEYFENNDTSTYLSADITITETRQTYTVYGAELPVLGEYPALRFQCADKLGTFYVKILSIEEYKLSKLTITNFSDIPNFTVGNYIEVYGSSGNTRLMFGGSIYTYSYDNQTYFGSDFVPIKGDTIIIPVWQVNYENMTYAPFKGNITLTANELELDILIPDPENEGYYYFDTSYINKVPITFTNGNATIDFKAQMEKDEGGGGYGEEENAPIIEPSVYIKK